MQDGDERAKQPRLTLMEEILLMGLKDKQVRYFVPLMDNTGCVVVFAWHAVFGCLFHQSVQLQRYTHKSCLDFV